MGTLTYTATVSVDGYAADASGDFNWSAPSGEVFRFHVERLGPVVHEVLGRRTYKLMEYWLSPPEDDSWSPDEHEFAERWKAIPRTVVSSTMTANDLVSDRDRLVPRLDLDTLRRIVDEAPGEVEIFGPTTAGAAIRAGLVSDLRLFTVPRVVGGGLRALPPDTTLDLELAAHRVFAGGTAYSHYRTR